MKHLENNFFIDESNRIEGINRPATPAEVKEFDRFMALEKITLADMKKFVKVYQPDAELRRMKGQNVSVGGYVPPEGGIEIRKGLIALLKAVSALEPWLRRRKAYFVHMEYERLHPFTDGNGRSGRMLWLWMMQDAPLGFLHHWYYQSLAEDRV